MRASPGSVGRCAFRKISSAAAAGGAARGCGSPGWRHESQKPARPRAGGRAQARNPRAGVGGRAVRELAEFAGEFLRRRVRARSALRRALEPPHHDAQLAPVKFAGLVNGLKSPGGGKTPHVPIDLAAQGRSRDGDGGRGTRPSPTCGGTPRGNSEECSGAPAPRRPDLSPASQRGCHRGPFPPRNRSSKRAAGSGRRG